MPSTVGIVASCITELPTLTINAVTNFNQDRATFNATVSANYQSTTVKFQYNTTNNFASYTEVTATGSPVTGQSVAVYFNATGLSVGTTYYVRAVISNGIGTVTTASTSFATWSLKTYLNTTAGSYTISVPSITPTGGAAIAPTIYEMLIFGGGGGANWSGGGGGGYRLASTKLSSTAGTQNITGAVGGGGVEGNGGAGNGGATAGGSTTLVIGDTTYTAGGGGAGGHPGANSAPTGTGGAVGTGDNGANAGGSNTYGYQYVSGYNQWSDPSCGCAITNKDGSCITYNTCNNPNSPIYSWDPTYYAGGGGGGINGAGANAVTQGSNSHNGGAGGAGGGLYGLNGGNGGGGFGTQSLGAKGSVTAGGVVVGTGGGWIGGKAGVAGGVTFKYYGP